MTNNQKEKLFSNKFIQNFLENESTVFLNDIEDSLSKICWINLFENNISFLILVTTNLIDKYVLTLNLNF